jgi:hypothetical protein
MDIEKGKTGKIIGGIVAELFVECKEDFESCGYAVFLVFPRGIFDGETPLNVWRSKNTDVEAMFKEAALFGDLSIPIFGKRDALHIMCRYKQDPSKFLLKQVSFQGQGAKENIDHFLDVACDGQGEIFREDRVVIVPAEKVPDYLYPPLEDRIALYSSSPSI